MLPLGNSYLPFVRTRECCVNAMHDASCDPQHGVKRGVGVHGETAAAQHSAVPATVAAAGGDGPRWHLLGPKPRYRRPCE